MKTEGLELVCVCVYPQMKKNNPKLRSSGLLLWLESQADLIW